MGKARSSIGRFSWRYGQRKRRSAVSRKTVSTCVTSEKRKFERTPIKSPYKSPLYKARPSPACKRQKLKIKSVRSLFDESVFVDEADASFSKENANCESLDEEFNVLSSSTVSVEEGSTTDEETFSEIAETHSKTDTEALIPSEKRPESSEESCNTQQGSENIDDSDITIKMMQLTPIVMKNLSEKDGLDVVMLTFFEMVANGTYPLDNIAFLLWTEVVKWHQCSNTSGMRYSRQTKLFWKLGWRLFGKRFVNFMGGFKSHGEVVLNLTDKGTYKPNTSEINFAVPDTGVLRNFDPYDDTGGREPGIYKDIIETLSKSLMERSACITFDGKNIKQGLTEDAGDVDLLGHEKGLSLAQRNEALESDIMEVRTIEESLFRIVQEGKEIQNTDKCEIIQVLQTVISKAGRKCSNIRIFENY